MNNEETFGFQPTDKAHFKATLKAEILLRLYNKLPIWRIKKRRKTIKKLLDIKQPIYEIYSPFHVSYGYNIHVGKNFFSNYNLIMIDHTDIYIGDDVRIAPNVTITTVKHPLEAEKRAIQYMDNTFHPDGIGDYEINAPVHIGNKCGLHPV